MLHTHIPIQCGLAEYSILMCIISPYTPDFRVAAAKVQSPFLINAQRSDSIYKREICKSKQANRYSIHTCNCVSLISMNDCIEDN
uniref:Uncharacterized protein n=1 Tax=Anguilla anguilla TaxID=7936 RepID=A0A0E9WYZ2_ANGAN